ncbi:MAG: tetratricopeptide repeat protein [Bacteroidetes bacterium]|nr:tetratricopeptide repeat protein [Bacteroidota bacterium]
MKYQLIHIFLFLSVCLFAQQKGASPIISNNLNIESTSTYAVVIGISDYQDKDIPDLRFADRDAEAFANFLRSPAGGSLDADHLSLLTNEQATAGRIAEALDALIELAKEGDQVIIYFSGHGDVERKTVSQPGFLLAWDAPTRVYMGGGTYSLAFLQEVVTTLSTLNLAKVTVITDACHAGKLAGSQIGGGQLTSANLAKQFANEVKILSCQPNEYSMEGEQWGGGRGCFSYHLVDGLFGLADRNADGTVTTGEIDRYLEDHVTLEASPQSQVPMLLGNKTERLATVDASILTALKKSKEKGLPIFAATEGRGFEDEVLAKVDSSIRQMYRAFKLAVEEKRFLEPAGNCAEDYYAQLTQVEGLAPLQGFMKRNYAAALQDDAQQVMNNWMKNSDDQLLSAAASGPKGLLPIKVFTEKVRSYPRLLGRAADLLGKDHYMYATLQARRYFFEGYLLANSDRNPNQELAGRALAAFRTALDWQAELPQAYWQMSKVFCYNLLQPDSAEIYTQKAKDLNPAWVLPYTDLAFMYSEKHRDFDKAIYYLNQAMQLDSNSAAVWEVWGNIYMNKNEFLNAEIYLKKAIQLDSTFIPTYALLGIVYENTNRLEEAEAIYKKGIQLDSTSYVFYANLGIVYAKKNRYAEAEELLKKAIQLDSTRAINHSNLAVIYSIMNRNAEAEQQYKKAIQLDSTNATIQCNLGHIYTKTHRYAEAEQQFKKAIQLDSTNINFYNSPGLFFMEQRRLDEAEKYFRKALSLDPKDQWAKYNMACMYSLKQDEQQALVWLEKTLALESIPFSKYMEDSDLDNIRNSDGFKALMKKYFPDQTGK